MLPTEKEDEVEATSSSSSSTTSTAAIDALTNIVITTAAAFVSSIKYVLKFIFINLNFVDFPFDSIFLLFKFCPKWISNCFINLNHLD